VIQSYIVIHNRRKGNFVKSIAELIILTRLWRES